MVKGWKVLRINSCYLVKDYNKKNSVSKGRFATFSFTINEKFRPQTKDSFPSTYVSVLFRIFSGIFANTQDLLVTTLVFLGIRLKAGHACTDDGKS